MSDTLSFLMQYGVLVLFAVVFVEQIGFPLPAVPLLIAAGALAGTGHVNLWTAIAVTVVAALAADWMWYELGRRRGRGVLDWVCRISLEPDSCVRRTEAFFAKHGPSSLILAKFIPGLSTIAPPLAGIVGLSTPLFVLYDGLGAVIWAGSSLSLGYVFSDRIEEALRYGRQGAPAVAMLVFAAVFGYVLYKGAARRRLSQAPRMTVRQLIERLDSDEPPVLIDVRAHVAPEDAPRLPGALMLPIEQLARGHAALPRDRDLVVYCACPGDVTSAQATLMLRRLGFERAWALKGGATAWHAREHEHGAAEWMSVGSLGT